MRKTSYHVNKQYSEDSNQPVNLILATACILYMYPINPITGLGHIAFYEREGGGHYLEHKV